MNAKRFRRLFEHSTIGQWIFDVRSMHAWLADHDIHDAVELARRLEELGGVPDDLHRCLSVSAVNTAARQLLGVAGQDDFSAVLQQYASDDHIRQLCEALLGLDKQRHTYSYQTELTINAAQGRKTLLISCVMPAVDELEDGVSVAIMDMSLLADAEQELRDREKFVSAILQAVPDVLMVYDLQQRRPVFQNVDLAEILGYTDADIRNTNHRLLDYITHPDDRLTGELFSEIEKALQAGKTYEITMRMQHNNGDWRHYYFRAAALDKDKSGRPLSAVVVARDITDVLKTRQILSEQQRRYQLLADNFTDVIVVTDKALEVQYLSPSFQQCVGCQPEQAMAEGRALTMLGLASQRERLAGMLAKAPVSIDHNHEDEQQVLELQASTVAGENLPVEARITLLRDEYHLLEGLLIVVRDIRERLRLDADLRMAAKVFESSHEGIYITSSEGRIVQANRSFYRITGFSPEQVIGSKPAQLNSGWHDKRFDRDIRPQLDKNGVWAGELMSRRSDGEAFLIWMTVSQVSDSRGRFVGMITTFRDITEAKSSEENIRKLAYYDPLTDLPNRQLLDDRLSQAVQRANRNRQYVAVLFMDLDGFKAVNDTHGHALGDRLLAEVGKRLKECIRSDDTVARLGGDEFVVILNALADRDSAENASAQVAGKIIRRLNEPFDIDGKQVAIGTSVGISLYPDDANDEARLIKMADTAMYHAKNSGKNHLQFFTEDMHERTEKRLQVEQEIRQAIDHNEFMLAFQPKLIASTQHLYGFEALLRWQHPERGLLSPAVFMRSLEELGLGDRIGRWVIEKACVQLQQWLQQGGHVCSVSINAFARHYHEGTLAADIASAIRKTAIAPELLTIEIPATLVMADMGYAFAVITELKELGVRVALDHFAEGMLSIPYLSRLPVDEVKINRVFTEDIDHGRDQERLVRTLITMARNLNLDVVAEGVERQSQLDLLLDAGCNKVQGFLFCRPIFRQDLADYMRSSRDSYEALIRPPG